MITICPQCQLSLAVSASDLRIAHGQVRCGRCASVFNALISLYESESEATVTDPAMPPPAAELCDEQAAATDASDTRIFEVVVKTVGADPVANTGEFQPEAEPADVVAVAESVEPVESVESVESVELDPVASDGIDLADDIDIPVEPGIPDLAANDPMVEVPIAANDPRIDDISAANDPVAVPDVAAIDARAIEAVEIEAAHMAPNDADWHVVPQLAAAELVDEQGTAWLPVYDLPEQQPDPFAARGAAVDIDVGEAVSTIAPRQPPAVSVSADSDSDADEPERDDLNALEPETLRDRRWWGFAAGAGVLALALIAQLVHFNRDNLATWPSISTPLSRFYASIGQPIALRGDLRAYDVRQLGAFAAPDAAGTLTVRASLRNLAARAQPMPLLRVTLQDRYGNRIASRDLAATEYQQRPAGTPPWPLIASGERLDTAVQLVDPGGNAVGFELDVCLPGSAGAVRCANDEPARAAR